LDERGPGEWLIDRSVVLLAEIREDLRRQLDGPLTDYSATIVAVLISEAGGFILHFGDGVASAFAVDDASENRCVKLVSQSNPETGEYANQTFYVTEANWIRHVRITPLADADCVVLCTDGAQDLFYEGTRPHGPALIPLFKALAAGKKRAEKTLTKSITAPTADKISGDDKTVVILARTSLLKALSNLADTEVIRGIQSESPQPGDAPASHLSETFSLPDSSAISAIRPSNALHDPNDATFLTVGQARRIGFYGLISLASVGVAAIVAFLLFKFLLLPLFQEESNPLDARVPAPTASEPDTGVSYKPIKENAVDDPEAEEIGPQPHRD
jgi:hypothetical protein